MIFRDRETLICCSTHPCVHCLILVCTLTAVKSTTLVYWDTAPNQLSYLPRASKTLYCALVALCIHYDQKRNIRLQRSVSLRSVCLNSSLCSLAPWFLVRTHTCSNFEADDVLICHLGPISEKRNHFSVLVCLLKGIECLQNHRKGRKEWAPGWAFRNYPQKLLSNRPSEGTTSTAEFRWHCSLQFKDQEIATWKLPLSIYHLETDGCLHPACLSTATKPWALVCCWRGTQRFHKPACQH